MFTTTRRAGLLLAAATTATLVVPAAAHAAVAYNPVDGEGMVNLDQVQFHARNVAATGTAAAGTFSAENQAYKIIGTISCLKVEGKRAGFIVNAGDESSPGSAFSGKAFLVSVMDLGSGTTGKFGMQPATGDLTKCDPQETPTLAGDGHFTVDTGREVSDRERNARH